jgi:tRNA pseudouridine13 synthase
VRGACRQLEQSVLAGHEDWCAGLEAAGLRQERRALRLLVRNLRWQWTGRAELLLEFCLPPGAYATSVLRELIQDTTPA